MSEEFSMFGSLPLTALKEQHLMLYEEIKLMDIEQDINNQFRELYCSLTPHEERELATDTESILGY